MRNLVFLSFLSLPLLTACGGTNVNVTTSTGMTGSTQATVVTASESGVYRVIESTGVTASTGAMVSPVSAVSTGSTPSPSSSATSYTLAEVAKHATEADCYTAINGVVYNVTAFFGKHPGGDPNLFRVCGIDATEVFNQKHGGQEKPQNVLAGFEIGNLQ